MEYEVWKRLCICWSAFWRSSKLMGGRPASRCACRYTSRDMGSELCIHGDACPALSTMIADTDLWRWLLVACVTGPSYPNSSSNCVNMSKQISKWIRSSISDFSNTSRSWSR